MNRHPALLSGLLATFLTAGAPLALAQDAAKASRFYEDALKRYNGQDVPGAILQLKNALQADKSQLSVHLLLAKALLADSQPGAAEVEIDESLRLGVDRAELVVALAQALSAQGKQPQMLQDPRLSPTGLPAGVQQSLLLERAAATSDLGDPKAALKTVQDARLLNPNNPASWIAEVPLRIRNRQLPEALAAAEQALKLAPENAEALYQLGSVLHASGKPEAALSQYSLALKAQPNHADARIGRVGLLVDLKRDTEALAELDALQKTHPRDPRGAYLRALIADRAGDATTSRKSLRTVTELLDPAPVEFIRFKTQFLILNGLAHFGLGELEKAKPYLELAVRQQPGSPLTKLLAQVALAEPNVNRAIELLDDYIKARPGDGQALLMLASANMKLQRHARAAQLMQDALKARDNPEYRTALGISLLQSGKGSMAIGELEKAYQADPKQLYAGLALVAAHLRDGQPAKALPVAEAIARANPTNATVIAVQAFAKAQAGDFAGARAGYERALKLDPTMLEAKLGLARSDAATGNYEAANRRLREAVKTNERNVNVLFELALLHELWGKDDEAVKWLQSAADASGPKETRANFALVAWNLRKGQPPKAMEAAKVLLGKMPEDPEALGAYATAQLANGDANGAKTTLTNAARRASFDANQLVNIARVQLQARDLAGAAYSLGKALSTSPDSMPAQALMAEIELQQGEPAKAEARVRALIKAQPNSTSGYRLLADVALVRGQVPAAIDALRKAHDIERSSGSLLRLFNVLAAQPGGKAAIELAESWLKTHPNDAAVHKAVGDAQARASNFAAARRSYELALKVRPDDPEALNNLANVLAQLNDVPTSLASAERALVLQPRNPLIIDTAGWVNHLAGKNDRALQLLRDARLRAPNSAEVRYHLAAVLAKSGRAAEAKEELTAALRDGGKFEGQSEAKALLQTLK